MGKSFTRISQFGSQCTPVNLPVGSIFDQSFSCPHIPVIDRLTPPEKTDFEQVGKTNVATLFDIITQGVFQFFIYFLHFHSRNVTPVSPPFKEFLSQYCMRVFLFHVFYFEGWDFVFPILVFSCFNYVNRQTKIRFPQNIC